MGTRHPFSGETLTGDMARGRFPGIRRAMLDFVGAYLLDFETSAQKAGLTLAQARVLGFAAVKPSSMKEMAAQFGCDPSNLTAKVDRLIALGLVERRTDPEDGRVKLIAATPEGVAASAALCHSRDWLAEVLGDLTPREAETVQAAFDLLVGGAARDLPSALRSRRLVGYVRVKHRLGEALNPPAAQETIDGSYAPVLRLLHGVTGHGPDARVQLGVQLLDQRPAQVLWWTLSRQSAR